MNTNSLETMLATQRVIVALGPGGVGKTTSSIAMAIRAAVQGRRVALLSIDPAKRLASALGIPLSHELAEIRFPDWMGAKGTLKAAMLDQKAVFDSMVHKHAPSEKIAGRILRDPMYIAASTSLSGPLEYMALARLQELVASDKYDLVVVDTPPDTHALDFLARPNVLSTFLEGKVVSRLLKPIVYAGRLGFSGVMSLGEKLLGGVTQVTGVVALRKLGEFILLMQEVILGFHAAGERVSEILKFPSTSFVLVATPTKASSRAALSLSQELKKLGYAVDGLIINRCLDSTSLASAITDKEKVILETRSRGEAKCTSELQDHIKQESPTNPVWVTKVSEKHGEMSSFQALARYWV
jgi:anion-transporting  ArsA/GET3 family ATPase